MLLDNLEYRELVGEEIEPALSSAESPSPRSVPSSIPLCFPVTSATGADSETSVSKATVRLDPAASDP
jgi:hypothetical protein